MGHAKGKIVVFDLDSESSKPVCKWLRFLGIKLQDSLRGHRRDITMIQINTKKKFISTTSKDGRMKFWTPPSSWVNYQEMEPLSYQNISYQENKEVFSDPEEKEHDSSENEDVEDVDGLVVVPPENKNSVLKSEEPKTKQPVNSMAENVLSGTVIVQRRESKFRLSKLVQSESNSDTDEYASSSEEEKVEPKKSVTIDSKDFFAQSTSSEEDEETKVLESLPRKNVKILF